jgi:hypothetical protein
MDAEINNVIYMELYSGPKMTHGKYGKTNVAGSIDRDSTVHAFAQRYIHTCSYTIRMYVCIHVNGVRTCIEDVD